MKVVADDIKVVEVALFFNKDISSCTDACFVRLGVEVDGIELNVCMAMLAVGREGNAWVDCHFAAMKAACFGAGDDEARL